MRGLPAHNAAHPIVFLPIFSEGGIDTITGYPFTLGTFSDEPGAHASPWIRNLVRGRLVIALRPFILALIGARLFRPWNVATRDGDCHYGQDE